MSHFAFWTAGLGRGGTRQGQWPDAESGDWARAQRETGWRGQSPVKQTGDLTEAENKNRYPSQGMGMRAQC